MAREPAGALTAIRRRIFIALGLLGAATPAAAEDPWLASDGVNGMSVISDASTLSCAKGQCSIWEVTQYADRRPGGVSSLRDLADYDCAGLRTATQQEMKLGADGTVIETVKAKGEAWIPVQPGSVGDATLAFACHFLAADPNDVRAGAFDVSGHHFVRLEHTGPTDPAPRGGPETGQPPVRSPMAVQIAATPTAIGAQRAIGDFMLKYPGETAGMKFQIEPATVKGNKVFRALVEGFADDRGAQLVCSRLRTLGASCFVWSDTRSLAADQKKDVP